MAGISVDLMVGKLIDVKKVFQRLDPNKMAQALKPGMQKTMRQVVDNAARYQMPKAWNSMPQKVKDDFCLKLLDSVPDFFESLLEDVQENIFDVFDIRAFAIRKLTLDKALTNAMFLNCGKKELKFIEYSGFGFGFLFGLVQTLIMLVYDDDWFLPFSGFVVGYATNWIALKMIFEPIDPVYIFGYKIQGMFLQRQEQVSIEFAKMSADHIFTPELMWDEILYGPLAPKFEEYVRRHSKKITLKLLNGMEDAVM